MSNIHERMKKILDLPEEQEAADADKEILTGLALAASSLGVDMSDDDALDKFIMDIKNAATKDKAKLKSLLRRFTSAKAKSAAKQTIKTV